MAAKKDKGHVPMDILEKRYKRLGNIIKKRGGDTGNQYGPEPKAYRTARKPPKKR